MGAYGKAEPLHAARPGDRRKGTRPGASQHGRDPETTSLCSDQAMGAYGKAEPLHQRALAIREKALGPAHPDTAQSLNNLAWSMRPWAPTARPSRCTSAP